MSLLHYLMILIKNVLRLIAYVIRVPYCFIHVFIAAFALIKRFLITSFLSRLTQLIFNCNTCFALSFAHTWDLIFITSLRVRCHTGRREEGRRYMSINARVQPTSQPTAHFVRCPSESYFQASTGCFILSLKSYPYLGGDSEEVRDWDYQPGYGDIIVAGNIHKHSEYWITTLQASSFVTAIISHGYSLPFENPCPPFLAKNNASSLRNYDFVTEAIETLLATKCIIQVRDIPYCCNPLTVYESEKLSLVLDLRHVNQYLERFSFRYENISTVQKIFEPGYFFSTFDLKSGYHHISIHPAHWKYLGFSWTYNSGTTLYFNFIVLPFGLSSACYAFTKVMRPLVKKVEEGRHTLRPVLGWRHFWILWENPHRPSMSCCQARPSESWVYH